MNYAELLAVIISFCSRSVTYQSCPKLVFDCYDKAKSVKTVILDYGVNLPPVSMDKAENQVKVITRCMENPFNKWVSKPDWKAPVKEEKK